MARWRVCVEFNSARVTFALRFVTFRIHVLASQGCRERESTRRALSHGDINSGLDLNQIMISGRSTVQAPKHLMACTLPLSDKCSYAYAIVTVPQSTDQSQASPPHPQPQAYPYATPASQSPSCHYPYPET